jgi:carbonic anhydrase
MSISRRGFIGGAGVAAGAAALGSDVVQAAKTPPTLPFPRTPQAALRILMAGNRRWQADRLQLRSYTPVAERHEEEQRPFAAVLTCADSRLSTTLIFDLYRGNLFVCRVAGNGADPEMTGSLEYAVGVLEVKLVLVLGHSNCGAVKAAMSVAEGSRTFPPDQFGQIGRVIDALVPAIAGQSTVDGAIAANARAQAAALAGMGPIVKPAVDSGELMIVPAVYNIANGRVNLV